MSYDLQIFLRGDKESPEDAYLRSCLDAKEFVSPTQSSFSPECVKAVALLKERFCLEEDSGSCLIELVESQNGVVISFFEDGQIFAAVAGWNTPVSVVFDILEPYLKAFGEVGQFWAYDCQLNLFLDLSSGVREQVRGEKLMEPDSEDCYVLRFSSSTKQLTRKDFCDFFESKPNHSLDSRLSRTRYFNIKTDVCFDFCYRFGRSRKLAPGEQVSFEMAYMVPRVFAIEAASEIAELCERFKLLVTDDEGFHIDSFDSVRFLKNWSEAKMFELRKRLFRGESVDIYYFPENALEQLWLWNSGISEEGELKASFIYIDGSLRSTAVWKPSQNAIAPIVDRLLVVFSNSESYLMDLGAVENVEYTRDHDGTKAVKLSAASDFEKLRGCGTPLDNYKGKLVSLSQVVESEVFDSAVASNSKSTRSCLKPLNDWQWE